MIEGIILTVFAFFKSIGIWGAFVSMLIENLGIPLPTEIGYLIGQDMINSGKHSYFFMVIFLTIGHLTGALISYKIGTLSNGFVAKRLKSNSKIIEVQKTLEKWYAKYGNPTVFLTRFVGYVRPWSSYVAGFANVKLVPFIIWTTIGSLIFNIIALYMSSIIIVIWRNYAGYHTWIAAIMLFLFFGFLIYEGINLLVSKRKR